MKERRLNLRFEGEMLEWAKGYAKRKKTNITQIITDHLVVLREKEEKESRDAEAAIAR